MPNEGHVEETVEERDEEELPAGRRLAIGLPLTCVSVGGVYVGIAVVHPLALQLLVTSGGIVGTLVFGLFAGGSSLLRVSGPNGFRGVARLPKRVKVKTRKVTRRGFAAKGRSPADPDRSRDPDP